MKVRDFEKAISELNCPIELDEVRLKDGHVCRFYGHGIPHLLKYVDANESYWDVKLFMWDEFGRGYSVTLSTVKAEDITSSTHEGVTEEDYDRDTLYDLKFD